MNAHTPGPWKARHVPMRGVSEETWCIDWSDDQEEVAEVVHGEANARLIAAAPDLLEALQLADAMLSGANMNAATVERKVRAAIAKATGGDK